MLQLDCTEKGVEVEKEEGDEDKENKEDEEEVYDNNKEEDGTPALSMFSGQICSIARQQ